MTITRSSMECESPGGNFADELFAMSAVTSVCLIERGYFLGKEEGGEYDGDQDVKRQGMVVVEDNK